MLFLCYPNCSTCAKAEKWLAQHGFSYTVRNIKTNNPGIAELQYWHSLSGEPLRKFFNTSGLRYKELQLKDKLKEMSNDEQYALLATDGMLVKRPLLILDNIVLVGFKEAQWEAVLLPKTT